MPIKLQPNMIFGNWKVIERDYNPTSTQHSTFWFCECLLCNKIYSVSRDSLVKGQSSCCNHCKGKARRSWSIGDQYGFLTIIGEAKNQHEGNHSYVLCKCQCGAEIDIRLEHLKGQTHSKTISCGCAQESLGENKIREILEQNQVYFQAQYRIYDFNPYAPFDFALFDIDNNIIGLIEYDGEQHFRAIEYFGGEIKLLQQKNNDQKKNEWCKDNGIKLLRIPYLDFDNITFDYLLQEFPSLSFFEIKN